MFKLKCIAVLMTTALAANCYAANPASKEYVDQKVASLTKKVGDRALGGIVFWVDATGTHGLVSANVDQTATPYGPNFVTHAVGNGVNAGNRNTDLIIANQFALAPNFGLTAAQVCQNYAVNAAGTACTGAKGEACYADWYLPSLYEMNQMFQARLSGVLTNLSPEYWTSTENAAVPATDAYAQHVDTGAFVPNCPKRVTLAVRCIRSF